MATKRYLPEHLTDLVNAQNREESEKYLNLIAEIISFGRYKIDLPSRVNSCYELVWKRTYPYNDKLYPGVRVKFTLDELDSVYECEPYSEFFGIPNGEYYGWIDDVLKIGEDVDYCAKFVHDGKVYDIITHNPELLEPTKELSASGLKKMLRDLEKTTE